MSRWHTCPSVLCALAISGILYALPAHAQTLVYCSEGSPEGFNPALYTSVTTFDATRQIFDQLTEFDGQSQEVRPALAESWEISDDGKLYSLTLRQGVQFQSNGHFTPGRPFNADDVLFSFHRQGDKTNPYHRVSGGQYAVYFGMDLPDLIERIEKRDDHRIDIHLSRPDASFLNALAMDFLSIQSAEYAEQMLAAGTPERLDLDPIGTGPFTLVAYRRDNDLRYRAFPEHWRGKPQIEHLVFDITVDPSVRYFKIRRGECQVMAYPNPADLGAIERDADLTLERWEGFNIGYLAFNTDKAPFDDLRVRLALSHAVDKAAILEVIYAGTALAAVSPIAPPSWAYDPDLAPLAYDPEKARALLAEAGYPNGFDTTLWAMPVQRPYNPNARRMAELIQADWAAVGVRTRIVTYEWGEYLRRSRLGEHDTLLLGFGGQNGDPDAFFFALLSCHAKAESGLNRARWCDQDFDRLLEAGRATRDMKARKEIYFKAQRIFRDQAPWIAIAHADVLEAVRKEVLHYRSDPFGRHIFYPVALSGGGE